MNQKTPDFGRFPWKAGKFVDRPEAAPSVDSLDQQQNDELLRE